MTSNTCRGSVCLQPFIERQLPHTTVFLNGKFFAQPLTGVQRFARELLFAVDRLLGSDDLLVIADFVLLVPAGCYSAELPLLRHIRVQELRAKRLHAWEQLQLPWVSRRSLLINLSGSAPLLKRQQICTFHDAAVFDIPEAYSDAFGRWYRFLFRTQSQICRRMLTVSEFSKQRLCHHLNVPASAIGVVPNGADHVQRLAYDDAVIERLALTRGRYLLAVGSENPSKNFAALVSAFIATRGDTDIRLVVVGGGNSAVFAQTGSAATVDSRIVRAGRVTDEQLMSLYAHARAFVFPSVYEGFGIPPLEAMMNGCPVLAARAASIPEVCGDAAAYFDPHDPDDMVRVLDWAMADEAGLEVLRQAGKEHAAQFTWEHAARQLLSELATLGVVSQSSALNSSGR